MLPINYRIQLKDNTRPKINTSPFTYTYPRLIGFWSNIRLSDVCKVLVPIAAIGRGLTILAGALHFSVRPREYLGLGFFKSSCCWF